MAYDLPISLQKMLYMEETYRTNSFLFKNKKEGLINFRTVSYILGILVLVEAGLFAICAGISAFYHENSYIYFVWTMSMNIGIGGIMVLAGNRRCNNISRRDGYYIVSISWILFTLLGMLPFYLSGYIPSITDAFFETMSGFTTTGATILNNIESLPHGLLFWRSFTQWIGGLGIVLFTIALLPLFNGSSQQLFLSEATGVTHDKIHPKIKVMARYLWLIYIGLTLLETILLMLGGMNLFDALDFLTAKIMLPLGGMFAAIFVGWVIDRRIVRDEVTNYGTLKATFYPVYIFILKFIAPIGIALIFMNELGLLG